MLDRMGEERHNIMALIKMLYIADRESLKETGFPITGDEYVAMKHGPVLSQTYDLMKTEKDWQANPEEKVWLTHFERAGYDLCLVSDPGVSELSEYEMQKLGDVCRRYGKQESFALAKMTHRFEEWKRNNPGESSVCIDLRDILEAVGRGDDVEAIVQAAREDRGFARFFAAL